MAGTLKVIALISGGKDSLFSLLHCLANGHEIIALANIYPAAPEDGSTPIEDIDSYMYQTVGHTVVPHFSEALGLPLYRRQTKGVAEHTDVHFSGRPDGEKKEIEDEIQDLYDLLAEVKARHPEANAVSAGAILSAYQRNRVERVALKLGLVPLAYLWQYPNLPPYSHTSLLRDMAAVGQDSRIIKIAHGGLDESILWKNVAAPATITRLCRAMCMYEATKPGAVLGEGGDFETLAIDGPSVLWKKRIEVEESETRVEPGGTAYWTAKQARCIEKEESDSNGVDHLRIPDLWDNEFKAILDNVQNTTSSDVLSVPKMIGAEASPLSSLVDIIPPVSVKRVGSTCFIANIAFTELPSSVSSFENLQQHLQTLDTELTKDNIVHTTLLLSNMSDFAAINAEYQHLFNKPLPPSRVTIACGDSMPKGVRILMSVIVQINKQSQAKNGLHVQGRSYWAPANIGPYSQAIKVPDAKLEDACTVFVAGQIPLVPASMEIYPEHGFAGQTILVCPFLPRLQSSKLIQKGTPTSLAHRSRSRSPVVDGRRKASPLLLSTFD